MILVIGEVNFGGSCFWHEVLDSIDCPGSNLFVSAECVFRILTSRSRLSDDSNGKVFSAMAEGSRIRNYANTVDFCLFFFSVDRCVLYKMESLMRLQCFGSLSNDG